LLGSGRVAPRVVKAVRENGDNADAPTATKGLLPYRSPAVNLRTQFLRILAKAGVETWPTLFQNLRSSPQTELTETWPAHVVSAWIGNSEVVASVATCKSPTSISSKLRAERKIKAVQNPVQQLHAAYRSTSHLLPM